jgi:peptidoglycan/LPS O-acetylase OafA/YrhL
LVWVGTLSYSFYLWQQLFLNRKSDAIWCTFPLNFILASGCAIASFYWVERPCLRLRGRINQHGRDKRDSAVQGSEGATANPRELCVPQVGETR